MSSKSNNQGRAYEYIFLNVLFDEISKIREVWIEKNSSFSASEKAWETLSEEEKEINKKGRVLVRASGTEPLIRVMVEAETLEIVDKYVKILSEKVQEVLG